MGPGKGKLAACLCCDKDGLGRRAGGIYHNDMGGGTTEQHGGALGFTFFLFLSFPLVPVAAMAAALPSGACIGSSGRCSSRKGLLLCPFLSSLD
jgi:hypothetical protein